MVKIIFPGQSLKVVAPKKPTPVIKTSKLLSEEEMDHSPLSWGKYKGQTPSQIAEHDASYLVYMATQKSEPFISKALLRDCMKETGDSE